MKTISKIILLFVFGFSGCHNFLTEDLHGNYSTDTFYQTSDQAMLALTGVYNSITFTTSNNAIWVFGDIASDDAIKGGAVGNLNDAASIDIFNYSDANSFIQNQWEFYYEGIDRANFLLYYLPRIDMDPSLKARVTGEAKYLRAYLYFNLVNIYGEIPLRTLPPINAAATILPKSTVANVYAQIETDLADAAALLSKIYTGADVGRATKGAAWGLLAKAHLYNGEWAAALTAVDSLDASNTYVLVPYQNNFFDSTQNNTESVFEIEHIEGQNPSEGSDLDQYFSPQVYSGYYVDDPVQNFVDEFETTGDGTVDPRLDFTIGRIGHPWVNGEPFDSTWSPTGYLQRKNVQSLRSAPIVGNAGLNYVYMRYADVLLFKAEALNELNRSSEALIPLNKVRDRARSGYSGTTPEPTLLPDVTSTDQTTLRNAIRHERRVELGFEFHRYFDLMRYGQSVAEAALGGGFSYATDRYFPIPLVEKNTNPDITN
jgi:hypothetical protein